MANKDKENNRALTAATGTQTDPALQTMLGWPILVDAALSQFKSTRTSSTSIFVLVVGRSLFSDIAYKVWYIPRALTAATHTTKHTTTELFVLAIRQKAYIESSRCGGTVSFHETPREGSDIAGLPRSRQTHFSDWRLLTRCADFNLFATWDHAF